MKKIIRLTEADVSRIVRKVLNEQNTVGQYIDQGINSYVNTAKDFYQGIGVLPKQNTGSGMKKIGNAISGGLQNAKDIQLWKKFPCVTSKSKKEPFKSRDGALAYRVTNTRDPKLKAEFHLNGRVVDNQNSRGFYKCVGTKIDITWQSGPGKKYQDSKKQQTTTKPPVGTTGQRPTTTKTTTKPPVGTTGQKPTPAKTPTTPAKPTTQPVQPVTTGASPTKFTPPPAVAPETFDDSQIPLAEKYYLRKYLRQIISEGMNSKR